MKQEWIDFKHVKAHASFGRVLEHYELDAIGSGAQRAILCPFHDETNPSCKINLETNAFHCFGCEAHGNILEFVMKMEGSTLREAARLVAEWCDVSPAPPKNGTRETKKKRKDGGKTNKQPKPPKKRPVPHAASEQPGAVNPPLTFELKLEPEHPFFSEHDISSEMVAEFGLGYCSRGMHKGRIAIPIRDEHGVLVAYAGRWAEAEVPEGVPKYLLPKDFQKSRVLYNLDRIGRGKVEHLVIVESYWSIYRLHGYEIPAVSPMGRSISEEHIRLLKQAEVPFITLMFDGDEPGRAATEAALPLLAPEFFVHVAELPDGVKPHTADEATLARNIFQP